MIVWDTNVLSEIMKPVPDPYVLNVSSTMVIIDAALIMGPFLLSLNSIVRLEPDREL